MYVCLESTSSTTIGLLTCPEMPNNLVPEKGTECYINYKFKYVCMYVCMCVCIQTSVIWAAERSKPAGTSPIIVCMYVYSMLNMYVLYVQYYSICIYVYLSVCN